MMATKICTKCGQAKPLSEYSPDQRARDGRQSACRQCGRERQRQSRAANPEKYRERKRQQYAADREQILKRQRQSRAANPEKYREQARRRNAASPEKNRERVRLWQLENSERVQTVRRQRYAELRATVFAHYGEACACCGSAERLTIDHVNGDGAEHREAMFGGNSRGGQAVRFYRWLIRHGFPPGFQTLCRPCNLSKGTGAQCQLDHQTTEKAA